jgi:phosphatidylinositol N-acetylglucosaminyltransferase subunit C
MKKWRKILYRKQDFEDNYVDSSFLNSMQKNVNVREMQYWEVVMSTCRIIQQTSTIIIFLSSNLMLHLLWIGSCAVCIPKRFWISTVLFSTILLFMTPILKDLTRDIATDSINLLTIGMFLVNLCFHDYDGYQFPDSISINAAMCAAVLMASRMDTHHQVSILMFLAVGLFALFPIYRRVLRERFAHADPFMAFALFIISICYIDVNVRTIYISGSLTIQFVCPLILVRVQKFKKLYSLM